MSSLPLRDAAVLVVDCQATGPATAGGAPMELGWGLAPAATEAPEARLLRLPAGVRVPAAVTRITGLRADDLVSGVDPVDAWRELAAPAGALAGRTGVARVPAVIHCARFEEPFLRALHAQAAPSAEGGAAASAPFPLELVCTLEIARRLYPELPRRGLRAVTGYFGRAVGVLRRSAEHVEATAFVWTHLVEELALQDVATFAELDAWLAAPTGRARRRRVYPMPRALRLSLPERPGVYRMLRVGGDVLYVGKATVLRARVNAHFRKQRGVHERALEMLAQARDLSFSPTETALEAALLETDEIKRLRPPYNVALRDEGRSLWFAPRDLSRCSIATDARHVVGPLPSKEPIEALATLAALLDAPREATLRERAHIVGAPPRFAPDPAVFAAGLARLLAERPRLAEPGIPARARLLGLGTAEWFAWRAAAGEEPEEPAPDTSTPAPAWDDAAIAKAAVELAVRAAHAVRRAGWLTRLSESTIAFREPGALPAGTVRLLSLSAGEVVERATLTTGATLPVPSGHARTARARRALLGVATFDRLRVLTTELRRVLGTSGASAAVRFGPDAVLQGAGLARVLSWL